MNRAFFILAAFIFLNVDSTLAQTQSGPSKTPAPRGSQTTNRKRKAIDEKLDERSKGKPPQEPYQLRGRYFLRKFEDRICDLPNGAIDSKTRDQLEALIAIQREDES